MEYRYTSHQTARGTRPDGNFGSTLYLVKRVSLLRLTYQIRLLTMMAATQRGRLVIQIPKGARASRDLGVHQGALEGCSTREAWLMGLYLCVFAPGEADDELDGVEVGSYDDFHQFRTEVADSLEGGRWGSRFPTLMNQPDSDTEWTVQQAGELIGELQTIEQECRRLPPQPFPADSWQAEVAKSFGLAPQSLAESSSMSTRNAWFLAWLRSPCLRSKRALPSPFNEVRPARIPVRLSPGTCACGFDCCSWATTIRWWVLPMTPPLIGAGVACVG